MQVDDSTHFWPEKRGPSFSLIAFLGDATVKTLRAASRKAEDPWATYNCPIR